MCGSTDSVFVSVWLHLTMVISGHKKLKYLLFFCPFVTLTKNNLFLGYMLLNLLNHHIQLLLCFSVIWFDLQYKFKVFLCQLQIIDSYSCLLNKETTMVFYQKKFSYYLIYKYLKVYVFESTLLQ